MKTTKVIAMMFLLIISLSGCRVETTELPDTAEHPVNNGEHRLTQQPNVGGEAGQPSELPIADDENQAGENSAATTGQNAVIMPAGDRVVIITNPFVHDGVEPYLVAQSLVESFGEEQVVHLTWPTDGSQGAINRVVQEVIDDPGVGALIFNIPSLGYRFVADALQTLSDDIFVVFAPSTLYGCYP